MKNVPAWDSYFMHIAHGVAARSKDPKKQVGALIVGPDRNILSAGYNGFLPEFPDTEEMWCDKESKGKAVIHAEANAVYNAARHGVPIKNSTVYVTIAPCGECFKVLVASGVRKIVCGNVDKIRPDQQDAIDLLRELKKNCDTDVTMFSVDGEIDE